MKSTNSAKDATVCSLLVASCLAVVMLGGVSTADAGLLINLSFDSSIDSLLSATDAQDAKDAVIYAAQQYQKLFDDPIQIWPKLDGNRYRRPLFDRWRSHPAEDL